jgi:DNA helicase-2/ATP-dependent DNA helicase PcrA
VTKANPHGGALRRFKDAYRAYQQQEERRLAYVAVTRARTNLLLSGAHWAGQKAPRTPSPFLLEALEVLGLEPIETVDPDENPYDGPGATLTWPLDPLGARRGPVEAAAAAVRDAAQRVDQLRPTDELARLLAERAARLRGVDAPAPTRVPASRFKDYVTDFRGTVSSVVRPMPERPYRQTRLGTLFHAWVEQRSSLVGVGVRADEALWERDADDETGGDAALVTGETSDRLELEALQETFERSEWAALRPLAVEIEIDFALGAGLPDVGAAAHIVICKLDAVYRRDDRGGRIEIVDWKTGKPPRTDAEKEERMLQLALYRLAYHRRFGVPLDDIDVALYYVGDDLVIRGDRVYSEAELFQRWSAARAAR